MVFRVIRMPKISEKIAVHLPTGRLACSDGGLWPPSSPNLAPPLRYTKSFLENSVKERRREVFTSRGAW